MNPSKRLDRAVTSEMETYNKLYTRMLCLIVEKFHFEVKEVDFVNVVDERMALLAEDALSARALKQVEFMKKKEKPVKPEEKKSEEKKSEEKGEEKMEVEKKSDEKKSAKKEEEEEEMEKEEEEGRGRGGRRRDGGGGEGVAGEGPEAAHDHRQAEDPPPGPDGGDPRPAQVRALSAADE